MKHPFWIVLCAGILYSLPAQAQFNLKVGYSIGFPDAPVYDELLRRHNDKAENYLVKFDDLNTLHGFDLGFRQRWSAISLEMDWMIRRNRFEAEGEFAPGGATFSNVIVYNTHIISAGLYSHLGNFSIGSTIDYNFLQIKSIFEEPEFETAMHDNAWSSIVSVGYTFGGKGPVALCLRPYAQFFWTEYDLSPLGNSLDLSLDVAEERLMIWGISFIVFNGQQ